MPRTVELRTSDASATKALGAAVARALGPGDVVSLTGELGAGKTCFVQGAAAALGVGERVTSPSFVLRRDYAGDVAVTHIDVYRLETLQEVLDTGYGESSSVVFVEWGDAMGPLLPSEHLEVELLLADLPEDGPPADPDDGEPRKVRLRAHGDLWRGRLAELEASLQAWMEG